MNEHILYIQLVCMLLCFIFMGATAFMTTFCSTKISAFKAEHELNTLRAEIAARRQRSSVNAGEATQVWVSTTRSESPQSDSSSAATVVIKELATEKQKPQLVCASCGSALPEAATRGIVSDDLNLLVYACPECGKETIIQADAS